MKNTNLYSVLVCLFLLVGKVDVVFAQTLPTQGEWGKTEIKENTTIRLTGDITLKGSIIVDTGYSLTIENATDEDITIKAAQTIESSMFGARGGSKLIIKGKENARIIIDGGAEFEWKVNNEMPFRELIPGTEIKVREGILNRGHLELDYVTIQNVNDYNDTAGAIWIDDPSGGKNEGTIMDHCIIQQCYSTRGSAVYLQTAAKDNEKNTVKINDTVITKCISGGNSGGKDDNRGGAIRTLGSNTASLYLTKVTMTDCYAMREYEEYNNTLPHDGNGGAIFWNGRGTPETKLVLNGCTFNNNISDDNGGAIKVQGSIEFTGEKTIIKNNQAPNGAGLYIEGYTGSVTDKTPPTITYDLNEFLVVKNNTAKSYQHNNENNPAKGAGIHFYFGKDMSLMEGSTIHVNMNGATVEDNTIEGEGGLGAGIYFEDTALDEKKYTFDINLNYGTIHKNDGAFKGGGMYISNGSIQSVESSGKMIISENTASDSGGGLYVEEGSYNMQTGNIENNVASTGNGGGVYVGGNLTISSGIIGSNRADKGDGGGVYISNGNFTMNNGNITENVIAEGNGGGVYINGGKLMFNNGSIANNKAGLKKAGNGGGICLLNGEVEISAGEISENSCGQYGGGLYVNNSGTETQRASFTGGEIIENTAKYGGGVCVDGAIALKIGEVTVDENVAINGGGICLLNGAKMDFGQGLIRYNKATTTETQSLGTAYQKNISDVNGIGGGIYLDSNTSLTFSVVNELGLYDNLADKGADDVFANGSGTKVLYMNAGSETDGLPKVADMNLAGFSVAGQPYWVEDYVAGDVGYENGTNKKTEGDEVRRYRTSLQNLKEVYKIKDSNDLTGASSKYLCLAIGHDIVYVTITKKGLAKGESAIFTIQLIDNNNEDTVKRTVLLTGDGKESVSKLVALSTGKWKVTETNWTWAYSPGENGKSIEKTIANGSEFEFVNTKKTDLPLHDEAKVENSMGGASSNEK